MLIKSFYTVQDFEVDDNRIEAAVLLTVNHDVYQGHFPGHPVVPGVIQIQMLRELAEQAIGRKLFIDEVTSAKYLNMIVPDNKPLFIEIKTKLADDGYSINGIIKNTERIFSKVKMKLR